MYNNVVCAYLYNVTMSACGVACAYNIRNDTYSDVPCACAGPTYLILGGALGGNLLGGLEAAHERALALQRLTERRADARAARAALAAALARGELQARATATSHLPPGSHWGATREPLVTWELLGSH